MGEPKDEPRKDQGSPVFCFSMVLSGIAGIVWVCGALLGLDQPAPRGHDAAHVASDAAPQGSR